MKHYYLITYDVRDEKRLRRVARTLEGYGPRLQYSVFRCHLTERAVEELRWKLAGIMSPEDDLLIIGLCDGCAVKVRTREGREPWTAPKKPKVEIL